MSEEILVVGTVSDLRAGDVILGPHEHPGQAVEVVVRRDSDTDRRIRYVQSALIALADALAGQDFGNAEQMLTRAQVLATLAGVEQSRIGNLIAWKQLRQTASASIESLPNAGDEISDEIERVLGIETSTGGTVEIGGQSFTQAQWDAVQAYLQDTSGTTAEPREPVIARHVTRGTGYVRVVPGYGGISEVTTEAGSTFPVHDDQIRWVTAPDMPFRPTEQQDTER